MRKIMSSSTISTIGGIFVRSSMAQRRAVTRRASLTRELVPVVCRQDAEKLGQIWPEQAPAALWTGSSLALAGSAKPGSAMIHAPRTANNTRAANDLIILRLLTAAGRQSRCAWGSLDNGPRETKFRRQGLYLLFPLVVGGQTAET